MLLPGQDSHFANIITPRHSLQGAPSILRHFNGNYNTDSVIGEKKAGHNRVAEHLHESLDRDPRRAQSRGYTKASRSRVEKRHELNEEERIERGISFLASEEELSRRLSTTLN